MENILNPANTANLIMPSIPFTAASAPCPPESSVAPQPPTASVAPQPPTASVAPAEPTPETEDQGYRFGELPARAPLAMAYVPMQKSSQPKYDNATAFARGTLFPGLDLPFMSMINRPVAVSTPLGELMALGFILDELGLYLNTHKDDEEAFRSYQSFLTLYSEGRKRYVELYGPISKSDMEGAKSFTWLKNPWPWEFTEREDG